MREFKNFACSFLQGELMRQFLLDEDIWLFIQNVKMKLKENPEEMDDWLDNQLHLAKTRAENFSSPEIPPLHLLKKSVDVTSSCGSSHRVKGMNGENREEPEKQMHCMEGVLNEIPKLPMHSLEPKVNVNSNTRSNEETELTLSKRDILNNIMNLKSEELSLSNYEKEKNQSKQRNFETQVKIDDLVEQSPRKLMDENKKFEAKEKEKEGTTIWPMNIQQDKLNDNTSNIYNKYSNDSDTMIMRKNLMGEYNSTSGMDSGKPSFYASEEKQILKEKTKVNEPLDTGFGINNLTNRKLEDFNTGKGVITMQDAKEDRLSKDSPSYISEKTNFNISVSTIRSIPMEENQSKETTQNVIQEKSWMQTGPNERNYSNRKESIEKNLVHQDEKIEQRYMVNEYIESAPKEGKVLSQNKNVQETKIEKKEIEVAKKDHRKEKKPEVEVSIPQIITRVSKIMNDDTEIKLKSLFIQCNNQMNLDMFENLIVVGFLKIGRYMSHTLFSKVPKENSSFVTYENIIRFFSNRFIDGTKDPSYYDDAKYRNMFKNASKESCDNMSYQSLAEGIKTDMGEFTEASSAAHQRIDHIVVPFKKCSILNFFNALKEDDQKDYLEFKDFDIYIREILNRNKYLKFFLGHVEFSERYIESVIVRLFYQIDLNDTIRIYLNDLRKHDLAHTWCYFDDNTQVQNVRKYFSYAHFYVYYTTFCQISSCKDMLIDDSDLYRFDNHALNGFIVSRIWSRISMKLTGPNNKFMCLNDWIYFIMNYEDMTSDRSIEFWFKLIDLDGDCIIRDHEIQMFFNIQMERLKFHYLEEPKFEDWLCQMNDAIQPEKEGNFTLADFKRNRKFAAQFFGCLVSLSKLLTWESRDIHKELQIETEFPQWSAWDIYCKMKYDELCFMEYESSYDEILDNYYYDTDDPKNTYEMDSCNG